MTSDKAPDTAMEYCPRHFELEDKLSKINNRLYFIVVASFVGSFGGSYASTLLKPMAVAFIQKVLG